MLIRKATGGEMLKLWDYPDVTEASPTARFFYQNITSGNADFWTLEHDGELGTRLMETILADLKSAGFQRATIGVGPDEEQNIRLYHRLGFTEKIKDCYSDPCAMDENMNPAPDEGFWLLSKEL